MMRSRWSKWLSGVGGVVLIGGLALANYDGGATPAEAHNYQNPFTYQNPFKQIMSKLNEILMILNKTPNASGAGGASVGGAGNQTLRWDTHNLPGSRFTTVFTGAVLDSNTGLVWEQAPDATPTPTYTWTAATLYCVNKEVGATTGWRLPSVVELKSVQDPSLSAPYVPVALVNGFTGVQSGIYWSATTIAGMTSFTTSSAWSVSFEIDNRLAGLSPKNSNTFAHVWCVRGPMSESVH